MRLRRTATGLLGVAAFLAAGANSCDTGVTHCQIGADAYVDDTGATVVDVRYVDRTSLGDQCDLTLEDGTEVEILVDLEDHSYRVL